MLNFIVLKSSLINFLILQQIWLVLSIHLVNFNLFNRFSSICFAFLHFSLTNFSKKLMNEFNVFCQYLSVPKNTVGTHLGSSLKQLETLGKSLNIYVFSYYYIKFFFHYFELSFENFWKLLDTLFFRINLLQTESRNQNLVPGHQFSTKCILLLFQLYKGALLNWVVMFVIIE